MVKFFVIFLAVAMTLTSVFVGVCAHMGNAGPAMFMIGMEHVSCTSSFDNHMSPIFNYFIGFFSESAGLLLAALCVWMLCVIARVPVGKILVAVRRLLREVLKIPITLPHVLEELQQGILNTKRFA